MKQKTMTRTEREAQELKEMQAAGQIRVLKWTDKHGESYWLASTPEQTGAAYLTIALQMHEGGHYAELVEVASKEETAKTVELRAEKTSLEEVLPQLAGSQRMSDQTKQRIREIDGLLSVDVVTSSQAALLAQVLDEELALLVRQQAARRFVETRSDYEYEQTEFITADDPLREGLE